MENRHRPLPFPTAKPEPQPKRLRHPTANTDVICNVCRKPFKLTREVLHEEEIALYKGETKEVSTTHNVVLTYLTCPLCGKRYVVIMDDAETLPILAEMRDVMKRRLKFLQAGKQTPLKLEEKYKKLNRKLDFRRRQLAEEYNGSFYQLGESVEQLDYCYRAQ